MRTIHLIGVLLFSLFFSCVGEIEPPLPTEIEGYVPVYSANTTEFKRISAELPRPSINGGKIYTVGHLLYQVEQDSGIHIINYTDPSTPRKIGFIRSFLCKEISVKNGFIYTNNLSELVVIDASNWSNVREVGRVANVFPDLALQYPPKSNQIEPLYFECPVKEKGTVIAWKRTTITNPKCWR